MSSEVSYDNYSSKNEITEFNPISLVEQILPRGHSFHGYSSTANERVFKILASTEYSDDAPLLGFGVDSEAELALGRAIATYLQREIDGYEYIEPHQYNDLIEGHGDSFVHQSKFDNIVWNDGVVIFQQDEEVVVSACYGGSGEAWGSGPLIVKADSVLRAISEFTEQYYMAGIGQARRSRLNALPLIARLK
jgi:hypothetical protein